MTLNPRLMSLCASLLAVPTLWGCGLDERSLEDLGQDTDFDEGTEARPPNLMGDAGAPMGPKPLPPGNDAREEGHEDDAITYASECERQCGARGASVYEACVGGGEDPEGCGRRAADVASMCQTTQCREQPPRVEPPRPRDEEACAVSCRARAMAVLEACWEQHGDGDEGCGERATYVYEDCVKHACDAPTSPSPAPLGPACEAIARDALQTCLATGRAESVCRRHAANVVQDCQEPTPLPQPQGCDVQASDLYGSCVSRVENRRVCDIVVAEFLRSCQM